MTMSAPTLWLPHKHGIGVQAGAAVVLSASWVKSRASLKDRGDG